MASSPDAPPWKGLHPGSVVVNLIPRTWRAIRSLWPFLLAILWGGRTDPSGLIDSALLLMFLVSTVGATIVHWATLKYRVHDGRLEIEFGLVQRQARSIDVTRVQNVETVSNLFQRLAGLVEVRVETASGTEVEGLLSALSAAEAQLLVEQIGHRPSVDAPPADPIHQPGLPELLPYGASGTLLAQSALAISIALQAIQTVTADVRVFSPTLFAALLPAVTIGAWLAGIGATALQHYGHTVRAQDGKLSLEGGLFTRRRVEWSPRRVQMLAIDEPLLRKWLGYATIRVETAAASPGQGGTRTAEAQLVAVHRTDAARILGAVGPGPLDPDALPWRDPHPFTAPRAVSLALVRVGLLTAVVTAFAGSWGLLTALLAVPSAPLAWFGAKATRWVLTDEWVGVTGGLWRKSTAFVPRAKIQALHRLQPAWWRRRRMSRLLLHAAGARIDLPPLHDHDAAALFDALMPPGAPPAAAD